MIHITMLLKSNLGKRGMGSWRGLGIWRGTFGNYQQRMCGLTESLLWILLVAEGSSSTWRAFGVAMAKVRRVNIEGSPFQ